MSSTAIEAPRASTTGSANTLVLSDTVIHTVTEPQPGTLTLDQRLAMRHQLSDLAELEDDRVERVAAVGLGPVAAYDVGVHDAVRDALAKFATGTFGHCETCGRAIPAARLEAVPYARRCLACQQRWEAGWNPVEGLIGGVVRTLVGEPQGPSQPLHR